MISIKPLAVMSASLTSASSLSHPCLVLEIAALLLKLEVLLEADQLALNLDLLLGLLLGALLLLPGRLLAFRALGVNQVLVGAAEARGANPVTHRVRRAGAGRR